MFTPNAAAIEGLDVGENPSLNFTFTVSDGDVPLGTTGYHDQPHRSRRHADARAGDVGADRGGPEQQRGNHRSGLSGTLVGSDVDVETLTYGIQGGSASGVNQVSLAGSYGTLTVNTVTGAYSYAPTVRRSKR